ncbi:unnamed protein product [Closterium sp. NIES-54]
MGVVAVGLELLSVEFVAVARGSSSSIGARPRCPSSFVSGFLSVGHLGRTRWAELLRSGVAIFDLDYDAILAAMYALSVSAEGDCYLCVPPDPGIEAAALGASESALPGTAPAKALHTFTLDSGASRCFFRDSTTLTPLSALVLVKLTDPSGGLVLACSSTVLPCLAVLSGSLSGLHLPSFSLNQVSTVALQDVMVTTTTPRGQRVSICTCTRTGRHLATFTRRPGSSLYTLATEPPRVAASSQVSASGQVAPPCSCRLLSHQTLLWHHSLGHPSMPHLRAMHSHLLVSGLPRSLPPLLPSPAPLCLPCVEGRERVAPHSSPFPLTTAPLQTLHMDVWGPACVNGQGCERYFLLFRQDLPVLRLHSDRGGEFSSDLLRDFCCGESIVLSFTLPASQQQNGIAELYTGLFMEVSLTSMIHATAPHFLWPCAVRYAAHKLNLWPHLSLPETSPTLRWTGKVGDKSAHKLSACAILCVFLGFPPDAPGWQFYQPTSRRVIPSQDVTFEESVPFYHLFPYRSAPLPPSPNFLARSPPPVDPLPPQGLASSSVSQVDPLPCTVPVEVAGDLGATRGAASRGVVSGGAEPWGAEPGGAESEGAGSWGVEPGGAEPAGVEPGGAVPEGVEGGVAESEGAESGVGEPGGTASSGGRAAVRAGGSAAGDTGAGGVGATRLGGARVIAGAGGTGGFAAAGPGGACTRGTGAAGSGTGAGGAAAGGAGGGDTGAVGARAGVTGAGPGGVGGVDPGAGGAGARGTCASGTRAGGARAVDPGAGGSGAGGAVSSGTGAGDTVRPRPYFPASPLPAPSPYTKHIGGLIERRELESHPALPVRALRSGRRIPRPVPGTHAMALRPSSVPLRVPLLPPSDSSLPAVPDPESDLARATSPIVSHLLATIGTDPFDSTAASALVAELVDFAATCRLDYTTALVAESESASPPSVGDPDAPDIPTPRSYAEAITVPPSGANIVDGMWIFRLKRPPGSPPAFKARYVARGFSQ